MTTFVRCSCGKSYTSAEWRALPLRGVQEAPAGLAGEPPFRFDLRNCVRCDSTISAELEVYDTKHRAWVTADGVRA